VAGIIDPLSLIFRTYSSVIYPYFDSSVKLIFAMLYGIPLVNSVSEPVYGLLKSYVLDYRNIMFLGHLKLFFFFLAIIALSTFARRFWCQSLCPLGASLSLFSRFAPFRRGVDTDKCTNCLMCEKACRMNAIHNSGENTYEGECIKCFECLKSCEYDAISFGFVNPFAEPGKGDEGPVTGSGGKGEDIDISRRGLIYSLVSSAVAVPVLKMKPGYAENHAHLIRPPGALPEEDFIDHCIRCNECMKVCPTNALHPTIFEGGLEGIFTPRLVPKLGYCEKNCVLCGQICPTDAIKELKISDKETTIFGTAYFIKDLCIPWSEHINCIVCEEVCPTKIKAIQFREKTVLNREGRRVRVKLPYVIEKLCIGCGICENKCPVPGSGAVRVRTPKLPPEGTGGGRFGGY
jgi:MauM/NapG family ferredoxin protein